MRSPRRAFTRAEWNRIHAALLASPPWERALFQTFAATGLRLKEVCGLSVGSVLWRDRIVDKVPVTPRLLKGHYGTTRWIPMTPPWRHALRDHVSRWGGARDRATPPSPKSPLFVRPLQCDPTVWIPVTRSYASLRLQRLLDRARVFRDRSRLSSHSWRKSYAQHVFAAARGNLFIVQRALNHTSVIATEKYAFVSRAEVSRAVRKADWTRRPRHENPP